MFKTIPEPQERGIDERRWCDSTPPPPNSPNKLCCEEQTQIQLQAHLKFRIVVHEYSDYADIRHKPETAEKQIWTAHVWKITTTTTKKREKKKGFVWHKILTNWSLIYNTIPYSWVGFLFTQWIRFQQHPAHYFVLAVGQACKAIIWPTPGIKDVTKSTHKGVNSERRDTSTTTKTSRLRSLSPGMCVNTRYINSATGTVEVVVFC